jgi:hypothetical protein
LAGKRLNSGLCRRDFGLHPSYFEADATTGRLFILLSTSGACRFKSLDFALDGANVGVGFLVER